MAAEKVDQSEQNSTIAIYPHHDEALKAVQALQEAGYDSDHVSIVGKGVRNVKEIQGWVDNGNEAGHFGSWGAFWGAMSGWLMLGFVWLPGIGWVAAGGWLAATLIGAGLGAGLGALIGLGVPKDQVAVYEDELKADRYLVIVHGTEESIHHATDILNSADALTVRAYVRGVPVPHKES